MPRSYDRNDYNDDVGDYKRKRRTDDDGHGDHNQSSSHQQMETHDKTTNVYLEDCLNEKKCIEKKYPICKKLMDIEIEKILTSGRIPRTEVYANVYSEKPIRVAQKVVFPIREYPKFNFVGKILGPKGNTLRQLQEDTLCKMVIMGRNSMRDHDKEEELRISGDPKYNHLSRDLHIEVSTVAPPSEAYHRLAFALAEIRKFLVPDGNDEIRLEQMRELDAKDKPYKKTFSKSFPTYSSRTPPPPPTYEKSSKPKVYSILEKARYAMDDSSYGIVKSHRSRDQEIYEHPSDYDRYTTPPPPKHSSSSHHAPYEGSSYERDYRREFPPSSYSSGYTAKQPSNGRSSSSSYRQAGVTSHYESGSTRSRESMRYRSAPYPKVR